MYIRAEKGDAKIQRLSAWQMRDFEARYVDCMSRAVIALAKGGASEACVYLGKAEVYADLLGHSDAATFTMHCAIYIHIWRGAHVEDCRFS